MSDLALLESRPVRADTLTLSPPLLRGDRVVHLVRDRSNGRFYQVGPKEQFIIERLDGSHTLNQIGEAYREQFGKHLDGASWSVILGAMWKRSFLAQPGRTAPPLQATPPAKRLEMSRYRLSGTLSWGDPGPFLERLYPQLTWMFSPFVAVPALLACAALVVMVGAQAPELLKQSHALAAHPELAMLAGFLIWVGTALHELAHGLWCQHYGGRATAIGLRWRVPTLAFYCESDDVLFFRSRRQRIATAAVGSVVSLLYLIPFLVLWLFLPAGDVTHDSISGLLLYGTVQALINYIPAMRLDGYLMLQSALNVIELGPQTWTFVCRVVTRSQLVATYPKRARRIYTGYAALVALLLTAAVLVVALIAFTQLSGPARVVLLAALPTVGLLAAAPRLFSKGTTAPAAGAAGAALPGQPTKGGTRMPGNQHVEPRPEAAADPSWSTGEPVLVVEDLRKRYGDVEAVAGTSFSVHRGEFFGVLGPNGAGKTTLIEILSGQRTPDAGSATIFGVPPWPRSPSINNRIGIQTQASSFFPELTALEHLETVAGLYGLPRSAADQALAMVGLAESAEVRVRALSGGQRQRLAIASALVHGPDLLFLDEPTAALDPEARRGLWALLRELKSQGCSIVYTTHHLDEAEALCDRVAIVQKGSIVALDAPRCLVAAHGGAERVIVPADLLPLEQLRSLPGVEEACPEGEAVVLSTAATAKVLAALGPLVDLSLVETRRPSLEDVYLNLTGKEYVQ